MTTSAKDGDADENEWADDDGRTVMTEGTPAFELPPDVALPSSMPPAAGPAPTPAVPKAAPVPASSPKVPAAPLAGRPMPPRAAPGPMPPRSAPLPPRAATPGPMPVRAPSAPKIPLPPPPAKPAPPAPAPAPAKLAQADEHENEASTSVLDPSVGAPLIAKMDELASEDGTSDGDGPTMAGVPAGVAGPPDAMPAPPKPVIGSAAVSPLAATAFGTTPELGSQPEESTRTVARDELFRSPDHVVVGGDDAVGDEATLAVPPDALGRPAAAGGAAGIGAALAATLAGDPGAFPLPPPPAAGNAPFPPLPMGNASGPMPPPGPVRPPQASWPDSGGFPVGPGSSPMPAGPPPNAVTTPFGMPPHQQAPAPIPRPMMNPTVPGANAPWPAPPNTPRDDRARTQMILLVIVGVVCVSIFGIGIYLFVSTMKEQGTPPQAPPATSLPRK